MFITSDLRAYADSAMTQGKQTWSSAQSQLSGVTEPYLTQLRSYGDFVSDRFEELMGSLKRDPRFGKIFETAESMSTSVVEIVQERVVAPVQSWTGSGGAQAGKPSPEPASSARKPATKLATKPATTRPATRKPATKTTARAAPAKPTPSDD